MSTPAYAMEFGLEYQGAQCPAFAMLMREGWSHSPTQIKQKLIRGIELAGVPDVALLCLIPGAPGQAPSRAYYKTERLEQLGRERWELEREALHNLSLRPASWQVMEPSPGARIAACTNDYLACARILDAPFMAQAAQQLGETSFIVGVPARGQMLATGMSHFASGSPHARVFKMMVERTFEQAGELAISPLLFWHRDGALNTVLEVQ